MAGQPGLPIDYPPNRGPAAGAGGTQAPNKCHAKAANRAHPGGIAVGSHVDLQPDLPLGIEPAAGSQGFLQNNRVSQIFEKKPVCPLRWTGNHAVGGETHLLQPRGGILSGR